MKRAFFEFSAWKRKKKIFFDDFHANPFKMLSLFLILSVVAFVCGKLTNLDDIAHRTIRLQAHEIDTRKADSFVDDTDFQRYSSRFDSTQKFQFLVHLKAPVHQSKLNIGMICSKKQETRKKKCFCFFFNHLLIMFIF